jgi:molybdopterin converting factor small subunit
MRVELVMPGTLAQFCAGSRSLKLSAATVREALEDAARLHPLLRSHLLDERGCVREHLHLFRNWDDVRDDLDTSLEDGDQLYVLRAMSGG